MANEAGEVRAVVTADTRSFQTGMRQASITMKQLRDDVRLAKADFDAGKISMQDYRTAVQMAREQATALRRETLALKGGGLEAAKGIGTVRSSLASLAAMSLGVKGTIGTFTSALLFMSLGNLTAVGVIAGIMAIAKGFQLLKDRAKAAREETEQWRVELDKLIDSRARELVMPDRTKAQLEADLVLIQNRMAIFRNNEEEATRLTQAYIATGQAIAKLAQEEDKETERVQGIRDAYAEATAKIDAMREAAMRAADLFRRMNPNPALLLGSPITVQGRLPGADQIGVLAELWNAADRADREILAKQRAEMERIGSELGRVFATNFWQMFVHRTQSLADFIKNIFVTIIGTAITNAIAKGLAKLTSSFGGGPFGTVMGFLFGSEAGLMPAGAGGGEAAVTRGGGGGPGFNMTVNVGAAADPFSLARDAQWQAALRESLRVASLQGFRG